jgi:hypothetical protein
MSRPGLYVMVIFAMLSSCDAATRSGQALREIEKLAASLQVQK